MKRHLIFLLLLFSSCSGPASPEVTPTRISLSALNSPATARILSPAESPTRTLPHSEALVTSTFTETVTSQRVGSQEIWTGTPIPTRTLTSTNPPYDPDSEPWIAFLAGWYIYLADYQGGIVPILSIGEENPIRMDSLYLKFSPDKRYLALAGVNNEDRPVIYILDIPTRVVIHREIFSGAFISDFSWAPDSDRIVISLIEQPDEGGFIGRLLLMDPFQSKPGSLLNRQSGTAVVQLEWPQKDRVVFLDYSCTEAQKFSFEEGGVNTLGMSGVGMIQPVSGGQFSKNMELSLDDSMIHLVLSPDGQKILYVRSGGYLFYPSVNMLLQTSTLDVLPCHFCRSFWGAVWIGNFIIGDAPMLGLPDGNIYLVDTRSGESRLFGEYGTHHPVWRALDPGEKTVLISYGDFSIFASDIGACLEEGDELSDCERDIWYLKGGYPDSFDVRTLPALNCCAPGEWCYDLYEDA